MDERPIKVLLAKKRIDVHGRGSKLIARELRDAGMEVVYTGLRRTPEQIVATAVDEDADVVGVSILSGAHMVLLPRLREAMDDAGLDGVALVAGGIVPEADVEVLRERGIDAVFHPATPMSEIVAYIESHVRAVP